MPRTRPRPPATELAHVRELDAELAHTLRARGQRVTSQRLVIHRLLRERPQHVTAEQVLEATAATLPGTSLPTVYATLELFHQLGIVRRVHAGGGAVLFDSRPDEHAHLRCRRCGRVEDLDASGALVGALHAARRGARRRGFAAEDAEVVVSGVCAACRGT